MTTPLVAARNDEGARLAAVLLGAVIGELLDDQR